MIDHRKIVPVSVADGDADRPREHDEQAGGRLAGFVYPLAGRIAAWRAEAAHARDLVGREHRESLRTPRLERRRHRLGYRYCEIGRASCREREEIAGVNIA